MPEQNVGIQADHGSRTKIQTLLLTLVICPLETHIFFSFCNKEISACIYN